ncbi:gamma-glutamyltransferase [Egicoccus sp. AB-alg6-2]|uniref:gamma-glutamyltransferase n=1 Tax=Egicoccus sp. AB-alg6-2 TaxID=3242692 RepID=UPI00359D6720
MIGEQQVDDVLVGHGGAPVRSGRKAPVVGRAWQAALPSRIGSTAIGTATTPPLGVVAAGHTETVAAAAHVLEAGGNAFDAAVAAGLAAAVVEPCLSSLGGGGFLLAHTAAGEEVLFDFFVDTPGRGVDDEVEPRLDAVTLRFGAADQVFHVGHGSVAVPGCLAGYLHVHHRLGRLPLARVVEPARRMAADGVVLGPGQTAVVHLLEPILTRSPEGARRFRPDGRRLAGDEAVRNQKLADFLDAVAAGTTAGFADAPIAAAIAADMAANGGLLSAEDLRAYEVVEREPLSVAYRDAVLVTNPLPSLGGTLIGRGLQLLDTREPAAFGSGRRLRDLAEVFDDVWRHHTSPTAVKGTTHVSVCDAEGNLASMTTSNGSCSGVILGDTGVMANNITGESDLNPHLRVGAQPPRLRHPAGRRVGSMMAPSLLYRPDAPPLALGSGGSERIRTAMTQVVVNLVDHGFDVEAAVRAPRIHWDGAVVQVEPGFAEAAIAELATEREVNVWRVSDLYFGGTHVAGPDGARAGDPRRGGASVALLP